MGAIRLDTHHIRGDRHFPRCFRFPLEADGRGHARKNRQPRG